MTNPNPERAMENLVRRALVPKGLRPRTDEQIAAMLDTIGGVPVSQEKLQRMLRKINGQEPMSPAPEKVLPCTAPPMSESEQSAVALHRAQGKLPPDIASRITDLERRAARPPEGDGAGDGS